MRVNKKGQITLPKHVLENMEIIPGETQIDFILDKLGNCYLQKINTKNENPNRFRTANKIVKPTKTTDEIIKNTRHE